MTALLRDQPFFGSLALRLPIRPDASRETLASDGREIRYSPGWVANTDADLIKTAIGRVVLACALKHHTRRGERDPGRWQQASQLVTHGLLRDAGFKLPPDTQAWDGISVEQAYDRLPEPQEDGGQGSDGPPAAGGGSGAGDPQPDDADDTAGGDEVDDSDHQGGGNDDGDPQGEEGPGGDGPSDAPESFDPSGTGEVMDSPRMHRRRRRRPGARRHLRRGAGLGRGHAPGAEPRQGAGQGARRGGGDRSRRPPQHPRLAPRCCAAT